MIKNITQNVYLVGIKDWNVRDFHGYETKNGSTYNSYIIKDKKNVLMDTVDKRATNEWLENVEKSLNGENIENSNLK